MRVMDLDHLVLTVGDMETTVRFYESVLGMEKTVFGEGRVALKMEGQKINLHEAGRELEPKAANPTPGSADLCFVTPLTIGEAMHHVTTRGVTIIEGPVDRTGARGPMQSFYFRDPDGNLIEICSYSR